MKRLALWNRLVRPKQEQTKAWLAVLARGMLREGQSIFLIEQLQPNWLPSVQRRWSYYLASRLIKGVMVSAIVGSGVALLVALVVAVSPDLGLEPFDSAITAILSVVLGLPIGLIGGVLDASLSWREIASKRPGITARMFKVLWTGILIGIAFGLFIVTIIAIWSHFLQLESATADMLPLGILAGISCCWSLGPLWCLHTLRRNAKNDIQLAEALRLFRPQAFGPRSMAKFLLKFIGALMILSGLALAAIVSLDSECFTCLFFLGLPLIIGLLLVMFVNSFQAGVVVMKTRPNQGVRLSAITGLRVGGALGICAGILVGLQGGNESWQAGAIIGLIVAIAFGLWYGGLDAAQHWILRFLLWGAGAMPWRYASFLDYAAEDLHFLQKVGGGYIFVHRYLLEHFAAMSPDGRGGTVETALHLL